MELGATEEQEQARKETCRGFQRLLTRKLKQVSLRSLFGEECWLVSVAQRWFHCLEALGFCCPFWVSIGGLSDRKRALPSSRNHGNRQGPHQERGDYRGRSSRSERLGGPRGVEGVTFSGDTGGHISLAVPDGANFASLGKGKAGSGAGSKKEFWNHFSPPSAGSWGQPPTASPGPPWALPACITDILQ